MEKGSIKLSDFFINAKLPKSARKGWPLVRNSTNEIIWVPGYQPGHLFRIKNESKKILKLSIEKIPV
jgi:hypothetical protein